MGHLILAEANINLNKAVISFWFRIPQEAIDATRAGFSDYFPNGVLFGVIPLICWGPQLTETYVDWTEVYVGDVWQYDYNRPPDDPWVQVPYFARQPTSSHPAPKGPSWIGVRVGVGARKVDPPTLDINIQTKDKAVCAGTTEYISQAILGEPGSSSFVHTDASWVDQQPYDYFGNSEVEITHHNSGHPKVRIEEWNHLLLSWEFNSTDNMTPTWSKMWCAINDENLDESHVPWVGPELGWAAAGGSLFLLQPNEAYGDVMYQALNRKGITNISYTQIESSPFSIPGPPSVKYPTSETNTGTINPIQKVELAELQVFGNRSLDTNLEGKRRAFLEYNETNTDVSLLATSDKLVPVNPKIAEILLGKRPEILLHGSSRWKQGENTGSLGTNSAGEIIASGQFKPAGTINEYKPDPETEFGTT